MSFLLDIIVLAALGVIVRSLAQRIFRDNPWGFPAASALTWGIGLALVLSFLFASVGLYLDLWAFGPYRGSDWQLNSGLPTGWQRTTLSDIIAVPLFLLYPVAFVLGATAAERLFGLGFPAIREPIDLPDGQSVIAVADTHLGLAPSALGRALGSSMEATQGELMQFLRWLEKDPLGSVPVWQPPRSGEKGRVTSHVLRYPGYFVMCGDTLELWDAPEESAQLATASLLPALHRIPADSVFVVGNHDSVLARDRTDNLEVQPHISIAPETWPGGSPGDPLDPTGRGIRPLRVGDRQYLFIHGHQFDGSFQRFGPLSLAPGHLRRAARFGHYAWLFFVPLSLVLVIPLLGDVSTSSALAWIVVGSLTLLLLPMLYMTFGRLIWRRLFGGRYDAGGTINGFKVWWRFRAGGGRYRRGIAPGHDDLTIVYGHTHMADFIDLRSDADDSRAVREKFISWVTREPAGKHVRKVGYPLLLNLPSWIKDPGREQERALFLYVDAGGYLMLGWDWVTQKPFHIPDALLRARRRIHRLSFDDELKEASMTGDDLRLLDWPVGFQETWWRVGLKGLDEPA